MIYQNITKRIFDFVSSFFALILLTPVFLIVAIVIKLETRGPVFFVQNRVGKDKKTFKMIKFRTMLTFENSYYDDGKPMENYDRITKIGKLLRKASLDELPQLINIFKGDMSIVGPRPTLVYQVQKYNNVQLKRLQIRPGLTGLAQVNGRNKLTWHEKIQYDLQYLNNITLTQDLKIILQTINVIFKKDHIEFTTHDDISKHENDVMNDVK